jgi:electron transfer flavoprotein alpha subunit
VPEKTNGIETVEDSKIWVLAEKTGKQWDTVTLELLQDAQVIAKKTGWKVLAIVFGKSETISDHDCHQLAANGANQVLVLQNTDFGKQGEIMGYSQIVLDNMNGKIPQLLLCPSTPLWVECASRLIALWDGLIASESISFKLGTDNQLEVIKSIWHNKAQTTVKMPEGQPWCICLRPGVAGIGKTNAQAKAQIIRLDILKKEKESVQVLELLPPNPRDLDLTEAERIVAGGRGMGAEGFQALEELAELLEAAVGASRVAVDLGWVPYERQVGQTGKTVKPRLYIANGISGATQHVDGMRDSEVIIAINTDKNANMFKIAHLGIVGDANLIVQELIAALKAGGSQQTADKKSKLVSV